MPEQDPAPRLLTDEQISEIIREDVLPPLAGVSPQATPRMVVLGGPQGSRKTTLRPVVAEQLGLGEDVVYFDGDDHNDFHPLYDQLAREHGAPEAARLIREDNEVIRAAILNEVRTRRLSIMFVGPYTNQDYTLGRLAEFRRDGYRTEAAFTALHPAQSQLATMDRHLTALTDGPGYSFLVSPELLELVITNVPVVMTRIEAEQAADALHVVDAGGIAFSKQLGADGMWVPNRPAADVVEETRLRPWDQSVTADFLRRRDRAETAPAGEDPQLWAARLARVDELAAPMVTRQPSGRPTMAQAARKRSTTTPARGAKKSAAPPPAQGPPLHRASGPESSSGRTR
ncbi:zeta toxin family protein [Streptomyces thinghirensis]|uniref:UDP-N-acetylglucosamine kinase n=1 Tax=Streptomyces thinghirensis TaxID=551547 RepID=A0ABP9T363_9ACTN